MQTIKNMRDYDENDDASYDNDVIAATDDDKVDGSSQKGILQQLASQIQNTGLAQPKQAYVEVNYFQLLNYEF